jgi:uncharacterized protein
MEYVGFFISIMIGISLGFFGSGGSIFAVPILVYFFGIEPVIATLYSLLIVGTTSAIGSLSYLKNKLIHVKTILIFGIPSIVFVLVSRKLILPAFPEKILAFGEIVITRNLLMMLLFAVLMIMAAYCMIKKGVDNIIPDIQLGKSNHIILFALGILVGSLTGLVGAGGGFLIIPALVLLIKLPIKEAIGTSLVIVSLNSIIGFVSDFEKTDIHWYFLSSFLIFSVIGIFIGTKLSRKIDAEKMKPYFGYFMLLMGLFIIIKELF